MTETGVRSSWEASEVNCFSRWKESSRRASIPLKAPASRPTSSRLSMPVIRWDRFPAPRDTAVSVMRSMGRRASLAKK